MTEYSMKYLFCILAACCLLSCSKKNNAPQSQNIMVHMATDGSNQAGTLQHYIDSCSALAGGTLEVPAGNYVIGPVTMRSNVTLQLDSLAVLKASGTMSDFTINGKVYDLIQGTGLVNISIIGKGVIDGNGAPWWAAYSANNSISRPRLVYFTSCTNVKLDGITLQNSPSFHFVPSQCTNVTVNNVKIYAPANSPNTDGIDPANSTTVSITNCTIDNGDDNIAIKGGRVSGKLGYPTTGITITGCTFLHGHGLSLGSETDCGISNIQVSNCTFNGTTNGIRFKSNVGLGGTMSNLNYTNITMTNVQNPLVLNFLYSSNSGNNPTDVPSLTGLTIDHLTSTNTAPNSNCGDMEGLTTTATVSNVTLSNLNMSAQTGLIISNITNVNLTNCVFNVATGKQIIATNCTGTGF